MIFVLRFVSTIREEKATNVVVITLENTNITRR